MPIVLYILFGAAFTVGAAVGLGRTLVQALRLKLEPAEVWIFSFLLGAAAWSNLMFALAATGFVYKAAIVTLGTIAIALGARCAWPKLGKPSRWLIAAAPFFILYLANALAPEASPDGSAYHLGLVSRYYREHGFVGHYENMYAHLSQGIEMLFLSAWAFGRNSAAAMVHFAFQCLLPFVMICYSRRFGFATAGWAAAGLVYFTPVYGMDGISAYNDIAGTAVVFGVFYLIEIWSDTPDSRLLPAIGLLAGFAFAIKYTLGIVMVYAALRIAWKARAIRPVIVVTLCALLMCAPWLAKNVLMTGNPVSPLFNAWFPNRYVTPVFEQDYRGYMSNYGLKSQWSVLPEILWRGKSLGGFLGPVWVLAPLALLAMKDKRGRSLLMVALLFAAIYPTNIGARFLLPALPFVALSLAMVLMRWPAVLGLVVIAHGVASWPDLTKTFSDPYAWRLDRVQWRAALRLQSEDEFLRRWLPSYGAARLVEDKVPKDEAVLSFDQEAEAYTSRQIRIWYQSTANAMLGDLLHAPLMDEAKPRRRTEFRFPSNDVAGIRLVQTASDPLSQWYVNELRFFKEGIELSRAPTWRLRASANPWAIREAFDGDPLTRWISGERLHAGGYIKVTMPAVLVDRVVVDTSEIESMSKLRLEILAAGKWQYIASEPHTYAAPVPLGLKRMATQAIARYGVRWILMPDGSFGADDYFAHQQAWGLELNGAASGKKLYRIVD